MSSLVTLPHTVNEILKRLSSLPILMQNHSSGGGVALGTVSLFPQLMGSKSPPVLLRTQLGVKQI